MTGAYRLGGARKVPSPSTDEGGQVGERLEEWESLGRFFFEDQTDRSSAFNRGSVAQAAGHGWGVGVRQEGQRLLPSAATGGDPLTPRILRLSDDVGRPIVLPVP